MQYERVRLCPLAGLRVRGAPGFLALEPFGGFPGIVDRGHLAGRQVGVVLHGVEAQGREQTRHGQEVFWTRVADDGLLPPGTDLTWLIDTATVIASAETYLLVTRMLGWNLDTYQDWVAVTWTRLLTGPGRGQ